MGNLLYVQSIEGSSSITDECDGHQHTLNQIRSMLQKTKEEAASKREKALSYAFSHQVISCLGAPLDKYKRMYQLII